MKVAEIYTGSIYAYNMAIHRSYFCEVKLDQF